MKNVLRFGLGSAILVGSTFLAMPETAEGFTTIGGSLNLGQRDFRHFNDFTGAANNNTVIHPNWPQYTGAELAMWKGGAEWNSRSHGDGSGDSSQSLVGSGDADFSFFWEGDASGIGGSNDNIISSLGGSSGGVLAYTETPISTGWRIRFYRDSWSWQDGPGTVSSGIDIQGVACHELGHALGLGHTGVSGSTMTAYISGSGQPQRSIQSDDIAGVQSIYGALSSSMPSISSITGSMVPGGTITITGTGFSTSTNRIWLQSDVVNGANSGGDHATIPDVPSTNGGTQISVALPASGWEGGALHVKRSTGSGGELLSESHPFDGGGVGGGNDTINFSISDTTPNAGQTITFSADSAPANQPYTVVWANSDNSPFFATFNGTVRTGTTDGVGALSFSRTVPNAGAGRTFYMEVQVAGEDSNTVQLNVN
ncbi:MAG: matrixin family metalloprotease [Planctomycetota bacterium]|nr:matrixin family metalloprotease [Planctomycetota bacterium]MDA1113348.1 matrixin family metalloprotease [Planctomycetota bacterium]